MDVQPNTVYRGRGQIKKNDSRNLSYEPGIVAEYLLPDYRSLQPVTLPDEPPELNYVYHLFQHEIL